MTFIWRLYTPRYLFNPATNYGSSGGWVTPVLLGGTGATTADGAATNLGFIKNSLLGVANGVASLDGAAKLVANMDWSKISSGKPTTLSGYGITDGLVSSAIGAANGIASLDSGAKVPLTQMPSGLGTSITGPTSVYVDQVVNYTINAFSTFATYTITVVGGTFTRTDATIAFTVTASAGGAASITINGAVHTLTVLASSVVAPTVTSPANAATNVSLVPSFTSSVFAYLGLTQTQDSVRWEISTDTGFGTTVQTYEGASNLTSWTPTSLSVNTTYYVRVRHHSNLGGWSNWSSVISFSTITNYGWAIRSSSTSTGNLLEQFQSVTCDSSGNIYAVGYYTTDQSGNGQDAILLKFNSSGSLTWSKGTGGSYNEIFEDVACDASGNIYTVGFERSSTNNSYQYPVITKWDSSGNVTWRSGISGCGNSTFNGVTYDASSGNIYAVGYINSNPGIVKWDSSGNILWQRDFTISGQYSNTYNKVVCDSSGNAYAAGKINNTSGVAKWDSSGNLVWTRVVGSDVNVSIRSITYLSSGNLITNSSSSSADTFLTKWDLSGNLVWEYTFSNAGMNLDFYGVKSDSNNNIYLAGRYYYSSQGGISVKLDSSGNLVWQIGLTSTYSVEFHGLAYDNGVNLYAAGFSNLPANNNDLCLLKLLTDASGTPMGALAGSNMTDLTLRTPSITRSTSSRTAATVSVTATTTTYTKTTLSTYSYAVAQTKYLSTF